MKLDALLSVREARDRYVRAHVEFEKTIGCKVPGIGRLAEIDAALSLGMSDDEIKAMNVGTATNQSGYDLLYKGKRYQVRARRMGLERTAGKPTIARVYQFNQKDCRGNRFDYAIFVMYSAALEILGMCELDRAQLRKSLTAQYSTSWEKVRKLGRQLVVSLERLHQ